MLKLHNVNQVVSNTLKSVSVNHGCSNRSYSRSQRPKPIRTVDLAYVSYETALSDIENLSPLIILHGLFGSKNNWTSMSKAIHKNTGRKVITVDARNHGDSPHCPEHTYRHMVEDIVKLMSKLNIPKASFLGHSMGGRTVMLLALTQPELVSSVIIGDISPIRTSPNIYTMTEIFRAMNSVSIPDGLPMSQGRKIADTQLTKSVPNASVRNFIITNLVQSENKFVWRINVPVLRENFDRSIASFPQEFENMQYAGNALFIAGGDSDYVSREELPRIRKLFPNAELTFIEGAGHWVHSEKPEIFLKLTCDFLINH